MTEGDPVPQFGVTALAEADLLLLVAQQLAPPLAAPPDLAPAVAEGAALFERAGVPDAEALAILIARVHTLVGLQGGIDVDIERTRLFEGAVACPINETAYVRRDKGAILADIAGFYRAFGFDLGTGTGEKADHLACELEFFAVLLVMGFTAEREGQDERVEVVHKALRAFGDDHLGEWLPSFCDRLARTSRLEVDLHRASILGAIWEAIARRHGVALRDVALEPVANPGTPYECDMAQPAGGAQ